MYGNNTSALAANADAAGLLVVVVLRNGVG
jgi:hypothetical protein